MPVYNAPLLQVDPKETLSDCVYFYDRNKKILSIAASDQ